MVHLLVRLALVEQLQGAIPGALRHDTVVQPALAIGGDPCRAADLLIGDGVEGEDHRLIGGDDLESQLPATLPQNRQHRHLATAAGRQKTVGCALGPDEGGADIAAVTLAIAGGLLTRDQHAATQQRGHDQQAKEPHHGWPAAATSASKALLCTTCAPGTIRRTRPLSTVPGPISIKVSIPC